MKKYVKPFFVVLGNNFFLFSFLWGLTHYNTFGFVLILFMGLFWVVSFSVLVVAVRFAWKDLEKHNLL